MTFGSLPSITATTLFVVPKSMPMILPIALFLLPPGPRWGAYVLYVGGALLPLGGGPVRQYGGNITTAILGSRRTQTLTPEPVRLVSRSPVPGAVAQLGERCVRNAGGRGSLPLGPTPKPPASGPICRSAPGLLAETSFHYGRRTPFEE